MNKTRIITVFIVTLFFSMPAYPDGAETSPEELIDKQQSIVEKARPHDWETYAKCADALISQRISSKEILSWIDRSIEIKETAYNRTVKGDFLVLKGKLTDAKKEYIKAIDLAQKTGERDKIAGIQWKILVAMGIENYNNFHATKE
jgi:hypothetical protein